MADTPQYWSPEFIEAFVEAMNEDAAFQKTARHFSDTIVLRCLNHPTGQDIEAAYTFDDGEVTGVELWMEKAGDPDFLDDPFDKSRALARATAPYPVWIKLDRGELTPLGALASPDYQIEGSKLKIMANLGVISGMGDVASRLDKTY